MYAEGSFPAILPVHFCDVYIMLQPNQTVSQRIIHFSVVGTSLTIFSIFRKLSSHLLLTKSHPSFKAQFTSLLIHISFLILPTGCDIYLLWALKALCMYLSCGTLLILPYVLVICDLDFFPPQGSWRAGTTSSLFLKLLKVNAPVSSRSFSKETKPRQIRDIIWSLSFFCFLGNIYLKGICLIWELYLG